LSPQLPVVPRSSRIELHHDASIVAALRASSPLGESRPPPSPSPSPKPKLKKSKTAPAELRCPRCAAGTLLTGSRGWGCSRWREGCRFVVWFEVAGKKLTTTQLRELVTKGTTNKKLAGGEARLVLDVNGDPSVRVQRA
jgi:hypothetical protein